MGSQKKREEREKRGKETAVEDEKKVRENDRLRQRITHCGFIKSLI